MATLPSITSEVELSDPSGLIEFTVISPGKYELFKGMPTKSLVPGSVSLSRPDTRIIPFLNADTYAATKSAVISIVVPNDMLMIR